MYRVHSNVEYLVRDKNSYECECEDNYIKIVLRYSVIQPTRVSKSHEEINLRFFHSYFRI